MKLPKRLKTTRNKFFNEPFPPDSQKIVLSFKKCYKNPIQADNDMIFFVFFMLAESGSGRRSITEKEDGSNGSIVPFVTSEDSRHDMT